MKNTPHTVSRIFTAFALMSALAFLIGAGSVEAAMNAEQFAQLCKSGTLQEVEAAIKAGAKMNTVDKDGWTPLTHAACNAEPKVLQALIGKGGKGVKINAAVSRQGHTLLMIAAQCNANPDVLKFLIDKGANAAMVNTEGKNAFDYAGANKNLKGTGVYELLRQKTEHTLSGGDLPAMIEAGVVSVKVTGNNIQYTTVSLTNKTNHQVTVNIPIGTYFSSKSGSVQNMVVRSPVSRTLRANGSESISVATACMNIRKSIPNSDNSFGVASLGVNAKLARVMKLLQEKNASYGVTQAAVWIVTDNPGDYALLNTLRSTSGRSAISPDDLAKAKEIVRLSNRQ